MLSGSQCKVGNNDSKRFRLSGKKCPPQTVKLRFGKDAQVYKWSFKISIINTHYRHGSKPACCDGLQPDSCKIRPRGISGADPLSRWTDNLVALDAWSVQVSSLSQQTACSSSIRDGTISVCVNSTGV